MTARQVISLQLLMHSYSKRKNELCISILVDLPWYGNKKSGTSMLILNPNAKVSGISLLYHCHLASCGSPQIPMI